MGLNPLIAARSYIFHVFFILPWELMQEMNTLFLIHGLCVCLCFQCVSSCLSVLKTITVHVLNFAFWKPGAKTHLPSLSVVSVSASGQRGAVVCLFLLLKLWLCCCFCVQHHWQHRLQTTQWVMNELPFITINQWAKPINCQTRDEFVFVRMTDCSTRTLEKKWVWFRVFNLCIVFTNNV